MSRSEKIIFLQGLGDYQQNSRALKLLAAWWKFFGLELHICYIGWSDQEAYEHKLERLAKLIDQLSKDGPVSLVGTSAGASAAVNGYCLRPTKVKKLILIAGKVIDPKNVGEHYFRRNPAFRESLILSDINFMKLKQADKAKMLQLQPIIDRVVYPNDNYLPGVKRLRICGFGHVQSIFIALIFYARRIAQFIVK